MTLAEDGEAIPEPSALEEVMSDSGDIDYAVLVKIYGASSESAKGRYSPAECTGIHTRRFTRLTNGFSKKAENHAHSVALFAMYYNFVRIHKTLRATPAMAAKVSERLWEMDDIVEALEVWEASERAKGEGRYK